MSDNIKQVIDTSVDKSMSKEDLAELKVAKARMKDIGLIMRGLNKVGSGIESGLQSLPEKQQKWLSKNISNILFKILKSNISSMERKKKFKEPSNFTYKALVGASGAGSGFFGSFNPIGATVFVSELYLSTRWMMRSILDIARHEGEDIYELETQLACMQVFALGGDSSEDDNSETSYYATRMAMAAAVRSATSYISKYGLSGLGKMMMTTANPVLMMIGLIASRLSIQISEKFIAQAAPVVGAAGGGAINYVFMDHFQNMAKSHFTIRRLERKYGEAVVKSYYNQLKIADNTNGEEKQTK